VFDPRLRQRGEWSAGRSPAGGQVLSPLPLSALPAARRRCVSAKVLFAGSPPDEVARRILVSSTTERRRWSVPLAWRNTEPGRGDPVEGRPAARADWRRALAGPVGRARGPPPLRAARVMMAREGPPFKTNAAGGCAGLPSSLPAPTPSPQTRTHLSRTRTHISSHGRSPEEDPFRPDQRRQGHRACPACPPGQRRSGPSLARSTDRPRRPSPSSPSQNGKPTGWYAPEGACPASPSPANAAQAVHLSLGRLTALDAQSSTHSTPSRTSLP
jgi:hypothetical protein